MPNHRQELVNASWLQRLSKSDALLSKAFEAEVRELGQSNEKLQSLLMSREERAIAPPAAIASFTDWMEHVSSVAIESFKNIIDEQDIFGRQKKIPGNELEKLLRRKWWGAVKASSTALAERADDFCRKYLTAKSKQREALEILLPSMVYTCGRCYQIILFNERRICGQCGSAKRISMQISRITASMQYFIGDNVWFEYGVSRLLRKTNMVKKALEGHEWVGRSGVGHEVDIFIVTDNDRIGLVECTRSFVGLGEVMKLKAKIDDIHADFGLLFSTSGVEKIATKYGKTYQVHTYGEVLENTQKCQVDVGKTLEVVG